VARSFEEKLNEARKTKENKLDVKIEVAGGNLIYERLGTLSTQNPLKKAVLRLRCR